jgi:hypothetical protein
VSQHRRSQFTSSHHEKLQFKIVSRHILKLSQVMIQIDIVCMSMIFHYTELHLPKCNASGVAFIKWNVNFNFQLPMMFIFLVFSKSGHIKSCSELSSGIYGRVKWLLTDVSEVRTASIIRDETVDNHFTRQYIPEDNSEHHTHRRENLKSHILKVVHTLMICQLKSFVVGWCNFCIHLRSLNILPSPYSEAPSKEIVI